jgi:hypothetical protein
MKFSEIANRLTGISTPFGGASWQPAEMEIGAARRVIAFLEDRRVLYEPEQMEVPDHCVHSVIEIRHRLSDELGKLDGNSELAASLRAMRVAWRVAPVPATLPHHNEGAPGPSLLGTGGIAIRCPCWLQFE